MSKSRKVESPESLAATRPLKPIRDPHRHTITIQVTVEVHTGVVEELGICECGQRYIRFRGRIDGFHKPPNLPGVVNG